MAGLMEIVIALIVGYGLWYIVPAFWRYYTFCRLIKPFASQTQKPHWFWGHLKLINLSKSVTASTATSMEGATNKMSVIWLSFIPNLNAIHPETAATILNLSEPKPKGRGEPYSIFTPFLGDGLVVSSGPKWERNRKLLTHAFHFDVLKPYVSIYNKAADTLLDKFAEQMIQRRESVEIMDSLNLLTLDVILRCSLSYDGDIQKYENHPYVKAVHEITRLSMERLSKPWYFIFWSLYMMSANGKEYKKNVNFIHKFAEEIIVKRRKEIAEDPSLIKKKRKLDFLDILLTAQDESGTGLSDEEILDEVSTFMFAGHDTTKASLGWAIYNLGKYPEEQEKLFQEVCEVTGDRRNIDWEDLGKLQKMSMFLKETLRMYPPAGSTSRSLTQPLEIEGVTLPAGNVVAVNILGIHYRPDVFPNPTEFRPERFLPENSENRHPFAFLAFSAGARNCLGKSFTMNEQKVVLAKLLKRFKVVLDESHDVTPIPLFILQPKDGIKVSFEER
ncbi:cytochrome P450 4F6-like [Ylistrum balloti]|uniref:cytochrome P450 4F6-like n=1 Tax=Ylistrum balloti TaxID=509963 RepID=UPI002905ECE7|nr:cytochrome P450 4F6-like [Ylistrum balloti]